jgi:hypothetical protein
MNVAIIRTMQNGVALSRAELLEAPRLTGQLVLEDCSEQNVFARTIRRARLVSTVQGTGDVDIAAPLFEPQLIKVRNNRMTLVGHEIHADAGVPRHVVQVWLVQPSE